MNIEDDILIAQYFRGELLGEEVIAFEERMQLDADFRKKVNLEKELSNFFNEKNLGGYDINDSSMINTYMQIINNESTTRLKRTLEAADKNYKQEEKKTHKSFWVLSALAASLLMFFGIRQFINFNIPNEDLYNEYIQTSDLPSFLDRGEAVNKELIEGQALFEAKSYELASPFFEEVLNEIDDNATLYLYLGITQMELNEFSKSESTFNKLISSNLLDAEKGYWYKSLLYLKMNNIEAAKKELNIIISKSLFNTKQAQLLLEDLD